MPIKLDPVSLIVGSLLTLALTIAGNLLTPNVKLWWAMLLALNQRGYEARLREQIKPLQASVDQLDRFRASERDLHVFLFQWTVGILAFFVVGVACAIGGNLNSDAELVRLGLLLLLVATVTALVILWSAGDFTVAGMEKKTAQLKSEIAALTSKLQRATPKQSDS